jgi:hypothetical protein
MTFTQQKMCEFEELAFGIGSRAFTVVNWKLFTKSAATSKGQYRKKNGHIFIFHNVCRMIAFKFAGTSVSSKRQYLKLSHETGVSCGTLQVLEIEILNAIDWRVLK